MLLKFELEETKDICYTWCVQEHTTMIKSGGDEMSLLNKEKMMNGFGKAVDAVNNAADKAGRYAKEKELDKKLDHATEVVSREAKKVGKGIKGAFSDDKDDKK